MAFPLLEVQFDKNAKLVNPDQEKAVADALTAPGNGIAHLVVLAHGWNNDMDEARTLYRDFLRQFEPLAGAAAAGVLAVGILWPSKRFTDADLIPGGAASTDADPAADRAILERLQDLKSVFGDPDADDKLDAMKALVPGLSGDAAKQRRF